MITAIGGGIIRDILLGALPPATFSDWRYLTVAALGSLVAFLFGRGLDRLAMPILVLDAAGLSLFAVSGALKGLDLGVGAAQAVILGAITGVGGGTLRDVLIREIPAVLSSGLYAIPALVGEFLVVGGDRLGPRSSPRPWVRPPSASRSACSGSATASTRPGRPAPGATHDGTHERRCDRRRTRGNPGRPPLAGGLLPGPARPPGAAPPGAPDRGERRGEAA
jgi:hypothetical protein